MIYTFKKTDSGIFGKAFEMAVKEALNRKNPNSVSPCGVADFRYKRRNYDAKQNGTCIRYSVNGSYIKGSNRVLYATHIAHTITEETETHISIEVDLLNTEIFVLDRHEFIGFLLENGMVKINASRGTANIQTGYNYTKNAYHGRTGKRIEEWARANELDDDIVSDIYNMIEG
jgi:hypothetical protein